MKKYKFGIIGAGLIADFHARAIMSLENAELTGICGTNTEKVRSLSEKYNCRIFADYHEMLRNRDVDIVTIATPSGAHMEPAIEAALHGKHVLCEKPIEISLDRIDRMIEAHAKAGTSLGGFFNYRFNDPPRLLKAAIERGRFGTLTYAAVHVPWWRNESYYEKSWHGSRELDGGGALMNQSIHMIDLLQYMMGPVESLCGYTATLVHNIESEDTGVAVLRFKNNALGVIYGTTASFPGQFRRMEVTGTKGSAVMVENCFVTWQFADQGESDIQILAKYKNVEGGGGVSDPGAIPYEPHARNIAAFIDSVEKGLPFEINGHEARKAVEIIHGIYLSAHKKDFFCF